MTGPKISSRARLRAFRHVNKHRGGDEVAVSRERPAADGGAHSLRLGPLQVPGDPVEVCLRGQGPDLDVVAGAGLADDHRGDLVDEELGELVRYRLVDQHAGR